MNGRHTRGLRIRTKCGTNDELVRWFNRFCDETSIFIPTASPRAEGIDTTFSLDLSTGEPALVGEGVVLAAWSTRDNRYGQPGMQIGVRGMTAASKRVFEQLLIARAVALESAQQWEDGTDVSTPPFDDRLGTAVPARMIDLESAPISYNPSVGKHTLIGMPIIPLVQPAVAAKVEAVQTNGVAAAAPIATPVPTAAATTTAPMAAVTPASNASNASKSRLSPNAFAVSVPAHIAPKGGGKRTEALPKLARGSEPAVPGNRATADVVAPAKVAAPVTIPVEKLQPTSGAQLPKKPGSL
ncbi:MAG TPA: hypothetical protein VIV11_28185, partial [Kofleriaceae bacterium]